MTDVADSGGSDSNGPANRTLDRRDTMTINMTTQPGTATQDPRLIVFAGETIDDAEASGEWLSSTKSIHREDMR